MNFSLINWLAVIVAGLSAFLVGGLWYSHSLFGNAWMVDSKLTEEEIKQGSKGKTFGFTALFSLIMSANLAMFLATPTTTVAWGAQAGLLAGIWTFCAIAIHSLFELKSWRYIFINGGYSVISLTLMGAIIGLWR
jgi:fatty acid desaturase